MNFYHQKELKNMTGNGSSELDQTDPHGLVEDEKILEVLLFASRNPMTIGDLKKLVAAQTGTRPEKIRIQKWYTIYKDHITLDDYEIHDGMNLELYFN